MAIRGFQCQCLGVFFLTWWTKNGIHKRINDVWHGWRVMRLVVSASFNPISVWGQANQVLSHQTGKAVSLWTWLYVCRLWEVGIQTGPSWCHKVEIWLWCSIKIFAKCGLKQPVLTPSLSDIDDLSHSDAWSAPFGVRQGHTKVYVRCKAFCVSFRRLEKMTKHEGRESAKVT